MTTVLHNHLKISSWPPPFLTTDRQPSEETHRKMEQNDDVDSQKRVNTNKLKNSHEAQHIPRSKQKRSITHIGLVFSLPPFSSPICHAMRCRSIPWLVPSTPTPFSNGRVRCPIACRKPSHVAPSSTHCCCLSCHAPKLVELSRFLIPLYSCSLTRLRLVLAYQARSFFCCWVQPRRRRTFHVWCLFFARSRPCLQSRLWDGAFWVPFARVLSLRHACDLLLLCWSAATWGSATGTWVVTLWIDTDARADRQCHTGIRNSEVSLTSCGSFCDGYKRFTRVKEDKSDSEPSCANCSRLHYHED